MKKKLLMLTLALAAAAGAHLSTASVEAAPAGCVKYCCPAGTPCVTCCPGKPCPRLACF